MARVALEPNTTAPPGRMTWEEFVACCDEDTWAEWVDGEVIVFRPASIAHQELVAFLVFLGGARRPH